MIRRNSYKYGSGHDKDDEYELQEFVQGHWHSVGRCTKAGGANRARSSAQRDGHPYRVKNITKGTIYVEVR